MRPLRFNTCTRQWSWQQKVQLAHRLVYASASCRRSCSPLFLHLAGFFVAIFLYWVTCGLGAGICYHRLLTHRSFKTPKWFEYAADDLCRHRGRRRTASLGGHSPHASPIYGCGGRPALSPRWQMVVSHGLDFGGQCSAPGCAHDRPLRPRFSGATNSMSGSPNIISFLLSFWEFCFLPSVAGHFCSGAFSSARCSDSTPLFSSIPPRTSGVRVPTRPATCPPTVCGLLC